MTTQIFLKRGGESQPVLQDKILKLCCSGLVYYMPLEKVGSGCYAISSCQEKAERGVPKE
jgi:hypothetical protein